MRSPSCPWASQSGPDTLLHVHVQPGARKTAITGVYGDRLKVAVNAPPVEGKANEAVCAYFAELFKRPKRTVHVDSGASSRSKSLRIEAADAVEIAEALRVYLPLA